VRERGRSALCKEGGGVETGFIDAVAREGQESIPYVVYLPRDYTAQRRWPVALFLHGAGERGSDGLKQTQVGIGTAIRMHPERFPCLVVMPQCPAGSTWGPASASLGKASPEIARLALVALDEAMEKYGGDPDRVYLTGLSMGGYGSWAIGAEQPQR